VIRALNYAPDSRSELLNLREASVAVSDVSTSASEPRQDAGEEFDTPKSALIAARLGGAIALTAAASLSFNALCDLARHAGLHHLAALLPIAVDAFAASALFVSYRLPGGHTAHRAASRTARFALALTVACNGLDHLLDLAGYLLTNRVRDLLLVAVASLPPLIVERLLHLQTALVGGGPDSAAGSKIGHRRSAPFGHMPDAARPFAPVGLSPAGELPPDEDAVNLAKHHASSAAVTDHPLVQQPDDFGQTDHAQVDAARQASDRRGEEHWLSVAVPVYRDLAARTGRRPTESAFHAALNQALTGRDRHGSNRDVGSPAISPMSLSTAKRIRALVEVRDSRLTG
jgi:hypothetical protein